MNERREECSGGNSRRGRSQKSWRDKVREFLPGIGRNEREKRCCRVKVVTLGEDRIGGFPCSILST